MKHAQNNKPKQRFFTAPFIVFLVAGTLTGVAASEMIKYKATKEVRAAIVRDFSRIEEIVSNVERGYAFSKDYWAVRFDDVDDSYIHVKGPFDEHQCYDARLALQETEGVPYTCLSLHLVAEKPR